MDPLQGFRIQAQPFYLPRGREMEIFHAAARAGLPVLLKGPTGCGKTRFLSRMAFELGRPLITVACHEDLSGPDLVGRFLFTGGETRWSDGPLTLAVRHGAICYLDEIVEGRQDSLALLHPLLDDRRILVLEKLGRVMEAHPDFLPVVSYNPGYQSALKDLKVSTAQRFAALEFDYPVPGVEAEIVAGEAGVELDLAQRLVRAAGRIRRLKEVGLPEGASTRLLIYAAKLIKIGLEPREAAETCLLTPITDDEDLKEAISGIIADIFG